MRVLVTGSRTWKDGELIASVLDHVLYHHPDMLLVHGACKEGADAVADRWAFRRGVPVERHPAEWRRFGRSAGPRRNEAMVNLGAGLCLAFIGPCVDPKCEKRPHGSHGATGCANLAKAAGIPTRPWTA